MVRECKPVLANTCSRTVGTRRLASHPIDGATQLSGLYLKLGRKTGILPAQVYTQLGFCQVTMLLRTKCGEHVSCEGVRGSLAVYSGVVLLNRSLQVV